MTDHDLTSPEEQKFTAHWGGLDYGDYQRAIAAMTHFTNRYAPGVDAIMIDAAATGRARQLIVAMLDLNEALMPALGDGEMITKLQALAAHWAGKNENGETDD